MKYLYRPLKFPIPDNALKLDGEPTKYLSHEYSTPVSPTRTQNGSMCPLDATLVYPEQNQVSARWLLLYDLTCALRDMLSIARR